MFAGLQGGDRREKDNGRTPGHLVLHIPPIHETLNALGSSVSDRLLHLWCVRERLYKPFVPAADRLLCVAVRLKHLLAYKSVTLPTLTFCMTAVLNQTRTSHTGFASTTTAEDAICKRKTPHPTPSLILSSVIFVFNSLIAT